MSSLLDDAEQDRLWNALTQSEGMDLAFATIMEVVEDILNDHQNRVRSVLPEECWVFRTPANEQSCIALVDGTFQNGAVWTEEHCCLPCRIRAALNGDE